MEVVFWHSCSKQGFSVSDLPIHSHTIRNLTYLINVLFSWQSLLFQVCSCSYSPLNPFFIKDCKITSEKQLCEKGGQDVSPLKRNQGSLLVHSFILRGCSPPLFFPITCLLWEGSCETLSQAARVPSLWLILFIGTDLSRASLIET